MIDYCKTVIYKLVCKDESIKDIYVGYTTNIKDRIRVHRDVCLHSIHRSHNQKTYRFIRNNGGWTNWTYEIIEIYACNSKEKARNREKFWFEALKPTLNTNK